MNTRHWTVTGLLVAAAVFRMSAQGSDAPVRSFEAFIASIRTEALGLGLKATTLDTALADLALEPIVVARDRAQPESVQSLDAYVKQRLSTRTTATAREMAKKHGALLERVEAAYGVPAPVVVAIWGLESNFGRFTGTYPTIRALATLAYDDRRPLFHTELLQALTMVDRGVAPGDMKGSWAGAMGQPQFMPSSFLRHAVDFDSDGRTDIWSSPADVFGSMAQYLRHAGWTDAERWGREVRIPAAALNKIEHEVPMRSEGCRAIRAMTEPRPLKVWQSLGVRSLSGAALPGANINASLVRGQRRFFLTYGNYEALLDYNCSNSYAITVGLLSDVIPHTKP